MPGPPVRRTDGSIRPTADAVREGDGGAWTTNPVGVLPFSRNACCRSGNPPTRGTSHDFRFTRITEAVWARLLSAVATQLVRPPSIVLTQRDVAVPETIMVPTRHGDVRCFVTRAATGAPLAADGAVPPVHIHIHGGAFLVGAPRQDNHLVRGIAGEVGTTVVNIDYSTWPDASYPRAHEECYDVLRWVQRSGDGMG